MSRLRERLAAAERQLSAAGIPTARADAEWLLAGVLGVGRATLALDLDRLLPGSLEARYRLAVRRRARREPLQRILGWEGFHGLRIRVTPEVLVPRPETEVLVELALALLPPPRAGARPVALDLGTGSGCIACALASERPDLDVVAIDRSPAAAAAARENARMLGVAGRVRVVLGDVLTPIGPRRADLLVSNPPYLCSDLIPSLEPEVSRHEPLGALDGGRDGLDVIRRLVQEASGRLRAGGAVALETAGDAQAGAVAALLETSGFIDVDIRHDLAGVGRFVTGRA